MYIRVIHFFNIVEIAWVKVGVDSDLPKLESFVRVGDWVARFLHSY